MKTQTVPQALEGLAIDKRQKLILAVIPEAMFGFPPKNASALIARIDCPKCGSALGLIEEMVAIELRQEKMKAAARKPIQDAYNRRQKRFLIGWIFGRFYRKPDDGDIQYIQSVPEYAALRNRLNKLEDDFNFLRKSCLNHWGGEKATLISLELIHRLRNIDSRSITSA